ncbi:50S ribosomal protein L11 methyltransferase [Puniceicoccaceae bacterium K14]|nr:50S ribosomal protein L11 methyltransferase [Puniceicoccaceae bacterium K14]
MIEVKAEVSREKFSEVEDLVFETEDATRWNLYENFDDKGYWVQGIFDSIEDARTAWSELVKIASIEVEANFVELEDKDWKESYKEHFKPWSIGPMHWVPEWLRESYELPEGHSAVWLDPGLAFGTGNHGTTRLCVEQLIAFKETEASEDTASVIDAGCGSGILAISAAKLGYKNLSAFDNDAEAVEIAKDNASFNEVESVSFSVGDLVTGFHSEPANCVMANILANVLMQFSNEIISAVAPGGWLILSGILGTEAEQVRDHFENAAAWSDVQVTYLDEWSCVRLIRSTG